MDMMHDWSRPGSKRRLPPSPKRQVHFLAEGFAERLQASDGQVHRPRYVFNALLPLAEAAWFFENPVTGMRLNLNRPAKQRIQFFAGSAILVRSNFEGLTLTHDGIDDFGRATLVTLSEPIWGNLVRIAYWMKAQQAVDKQHLET